MAKSKRTKAVIEGIISSHREGFTLEDCSLMQDISSATLSLWLKLGKNGEDALCEKLYKGIEGIRAARKAQKQQVKKKLLKTKIEQLKERYA